MMFLFQSGGRCFFSAPFFSQIFHICMLQTYTEPFPVMAVIEFQVCFVFPFRSLTVHDITVEDRHGVVFIYKPWFPALSVCLFP